MREMLDRVSTVLCEALAIDRKCNGLTELKPYDYLFLASAIFETMREPTDEMVRQVVVANIAGNCNSEVAEDIWRAMIDAALK